VGLTGKPLASLQMLAGVHACVRAQGGHKVGEKIPEFSGLFQSHKLTFP